MREGRESGVVGGRWGAGERRQKKGSDREAYVLIHQPRCSSKSAGGPVISSRDEEGKKNKSERIGKEGRNSGIRSTYTAREAVKPASSIGEESKQCRRWRVYVSVSHRDQKRRARQRGAGYGRGSSASREHPSTSPGQRSRPTTTRLEG